MGFGRIAGLSAVARSAKADDELTEEQDLLLMA
jgi:hypothetical protein